MASDIPSQATAQRKAITTKPEVEATLAIGQFNATRQVLREELRVLNEEAEEAAATKLQEAEDQANELLRKAE